jgi:hypothetical protein
LYVVLSSPIVSPLLPLHFPPNNLPQPLLQIIALPIDIHALSTKTHTTLFLLSTTQFLRHLTRLFSLLVIKAAVTFIQQQPPLARECEYVYGLDGLGAQETVCVGERSGVQDVGNAIMTGVRVVERWIEAVRRERRAVGENG